MAKNEVFVNGQEVACKVADGKSVACFPDPCWSPPPPGAGPIVIPYPNTAFAKDLAKCTKTVFISGKPVAKRDVSYIKTSTGNEPATKAFPQGVVTHTIKGKAYFRSWSMNVKVEGKNVCRHTDKMTHNHNPVVGNTGTWFYIDTSARRSDCKREINQVERKCGGQKEKKYKNIWGKTKKKWVDAGKKKWKKGNCLGLGIKPRSLNQSKLDEFLGEVQGQLDDLNIYQAAINKAKEVALQEAQEVLVKIVGKAVAKKVVGAAAGPVGWVFTIIDGASDAKDVLEIKGHIDAVNAEAQRLSNSLQTMGDRLSEIPGQIASGDTGSAAATLADVQRSIATANECVRARKCMLVPMKDTDKKSGGNDNNKGCCGGQTGHHLIPDSYMYSGPNKTGTKACSGYDYKAAPTVCSEGTNWSHGSHGALHTNTDKHIANSVSGNSVSYKDAREAAIKAHRDTFPLSFCSADCLREQLDNYHNEACKEHDGWFSDPNPDLHYKKISGGNSGEDTEW